MNRAAFLDRDGVINRDHGYVYRWEDFEFMPDALAGMRRLQDAGFKLIVVTNQSGIARGYYSEAQYQALTERWVRAASESAGVQVAAVYHCPHHPEGSIPEWRMACECRKPQPGMILRAQREHGLDLPSSVLLGDSPRDLEAAEAAGVARSLLVNEGTADAPALPFLRAVEQLLGGA
jgi:D-glycero-D-manno-heptose 1,7-bisphosphate phosphatase